MLKTMLIMSSEIAATFIPADDLKTSELQSARYGPVGKSVP
jgi:hypothetical protein